MKKIFFALIAVVAMASCSKDEVIEVNREQIGFGDVFVDNATRADYSNANALQGFNVYGTVTGAGAGGSTVALYGGDGATVTRGEADYREAWDCSETEYWVPDASYKFAAVVDATTAVDAGLPTTLTTVADNTMNLKDMLYAEASVASAAADQGLVEFTFDHLLSKVHFTVTSDAANGYSHTVTGIKVANFEEGTYTINGGKWTGGTAEDVVFAEIANVTAATGGLTNADMLLVPNAATFNVTFTVDLYKDTTKLGTQTKTVPVTIKDAQDDVVGLQKGHAYNFTIACSVGNPIQFSVTSDPTWDTTNGNVTVQ
ncbi:MAG: fimbrillin family protein [Alistipes sp.]|nr:fimbrillin family protein [Alistipes sp.]